MGIATESNLAHAQIEIQRGCARVCVCVAIDARAKNGSRTRVAQMATVQIRNRMFDCKRRVTIDYQSLAVQAHESHPQTREREQHEQSMRSGLRMCALSLVLPCSSSYNVSKCT